MAIYFSIYLGMTIIDLKSLSLEGRLLVTKVLIRGTKLKEIAQEKAPLTRSKRLQDARGCPWIGSPDQWATQRSLRFCGAIRPRTLLLQIHRCLGQFNSIQPCK